MFIIMAACLVYTGGCSRKEQAGIPWQSDYTQAAAKSKQEQKPMLLAFHAEWCGPCNRMKKEIYPDPAVIKAAEAFVPVMIDVDKQQALSQQYHADSIPMYVIVKPDGSAGASVKGAMPAAEFVKWLTEAGKN